MHTNFSYFIYIIPSLIAECMKASSVILAHIYWTPIQRLSNILSLLPSQSCHTLDDIFSHILQVLPQLQFLNQRVFFTTQYLLAIILIYFSMLIILYKCYIFFIIFMDSIPALEFKHCETMIFIVFRLSSYVSTQCSFILCVKIMRIHQSILRNEKQVMRKCIVTYACSSST